MTTAYSPGAGKFSTLPKQVQLAPGQSLHFQTGKGYYAGPGAPASTPLPAPLSGTGPGGASRLAPQDKGYKPPATVVAPKKKVVAAAPAPVIQGTDPYAALDHATLDQRASDIAQAGLTQQQAEIQRQAQLAKDQATADEAAITGFRDAQGKILAGIAPQVSAGFDTAEKEQGALGAGVGQHATDTLTAAQQTDADFAASQGQSGGSSVDAGATGSTLSTLGGVIPGEALGSEGAAETALAAEQPAIALDAGREELSARMAQAHKDNDGYAQQLIQLAATFPALKSQALTQLNQYEIDKANYRTSVYNAETQRKAENANEVLAGIKTNAAAAKDAEEFKYKWAQLSFQNSKEAARAQAAASKGKTIDVGASRLMGHVVYKDGSEDTSIKVKQTTATSPAQKAKVARQKSVQTARTTAYKTATSLLGKPVANKGVGTLTGGKGKYLASSTAKGAGVYPPPYKNGPRTTDNLALAARTGQGAANYADAQQKVWAAIAGDSLVDSGLSKAQVMSYVNAALRAAGWRPGS